MKQISADCLNMTPFIFFILLAQKAAETKLWQLHGKTLSFSPLLLILVGLHLR